MVELIGPLGGDPHLTGYGLLGGWLGMEILVSHECLISGPMGNNIIDKIHFNGQFFIDEIGCCKEREAGVFHLVEPPPRETEGFAIGFAYIFAHIGLLPYPDGNTGIPKGSSSGRGSAYQTAANAQGHACRLRRLAQLDLEAVAPKDGRIALAMRVGIEQKGI